MGENVEKLERYKKELKKAQTLTKLNNIIEKASFDDTISNEEYCNLYEYALKLAQNKGW